MSVLRVTSASSIFFCRVSITTSNGADSNSSTSALIVSILEMWDAILSKAVRITDPVIGKNFPAD
jgi:hypothetical protein